MYKTTSKHLEGVKKIIDTTNFTEAGGIIDRALNVTVSEDDSYIKNLKSNKRYKKGSHKIGMV